MQCHRSKLDRLRTALAGLPTGSSPFAGKDSEQLDDAHGLRIISRMERRSSARSEGRLSPNELAALSHRWSRQRASGTRRGRK